MHVKNLKKWGQPAQNDIVQYTYTNIETEPFNPILWPSGIVSFRSKRFQLGRSCSIGQSHKPELCISITESIKMLSGHCGRSVCSDAMH